MFTPIASKLSVESSADGMPDIFSKRKQCSAVERIPGKVSGVWLFKGTRVPVKALFENLESGATVENFLEWFPGVTRGQVEAVLEHAQRSLVEA